MSASLNYPSEKAGLPPGTLVHVGREPATTGRLTLLTYGPDHLEESQVLSGTDIGDHRASGSIRWVHCEGLAITAFIADLGRHFGVHPLVLEDILNTHQRPKFEEHEDFLFIVLKTIRTDQTLTVHHEQISILLFDNLLFTFREHQDNLFAGLRQRLGMTKSRIRSLGADYLAYAVMDTVVDQYFTLTDTLEEAIETMEDKLLTKPDPETFATIQRLRRELVYIRKDVTPLREVLTALQHCDTPLIHDKTLFYFRDVFDHVLRVIDILDSYRDLINGMLEIYLSSLSNRINEVMKVLTVFATIFIPLTFLVGIYGMNFDYMPELQWKWSYPLLWLIFFLVPAVLLAAFKKKKWL